MALRHPARTLLGTALLTAGACLLQVRAAVAYDGAPPQAATHPSAGPTLHDTRIAVRFPPRFKQRELAFMRSHLEALERITQNLAKGNYQAASDIAARRLGQGVMPAHERHMAARYMPKRMLAMGAAMHAAAAHFTVVAQDASVSGDTTAALGALAKVEARCVACHAAYRME